MFDLSDKVALVTGGASGIGRQIATDLAAGGARVIVSDINVEQGRQAADALGAGTRFLPHDVAEQGDWQRVIADIQTTEGCLNVLINNAGMGVFGNVENTSLEDYRRTQAINAESIFVGCQAALPLMKSSGPGSIVNLSSVAGLRGASNLFAYNAAKGAVRLMTKSIALHCAESQYNIRCNSLHPSFIDTPLVDQLVAAVPDQARMRTWVEQASPMGRMGRVEEVSALALFLASDLSSFINGAELPVDGGLTAR